MATDDRTAIVNNIYEYSYTWDGQELAAYLDLFTEDAVWEAFAAGASEPEIHLPTRAAIGEWGEARLARRKGKFISRHFQTNIVFDHLDAEMAKTRTMTLVTHHYASDEAPTLMLSAVCFDEHRRTPAGWRIRWHTVRHDRRMPYIAGS